uniref:Uncharacterized protein n=1 Tax=Rhizophora mucronata TaxID=61149 RepID=A0A2P2IM25_RHIMU
MNLKRRKGRQQGQRESNTIAQSVQPSTSLSKSIKLQHHTDGPTKSI